MFQIMKSFLPWTKAPLIVSAPMLGASMPRLAANVSRAGGLGFVAGGTDPGNLNKVLEETKHHLFENSDHLNLVPFSARADTLPVGVGFQLFNSDVDVLLPVISSHKPAVVWLFAPKAEEELRSWSTKIREATNGVTLICVQVGSVKEAERAVALAEPEFLVVQGTDAGGHGLCQSAGIISLVPEVKDRLAAVGKPRTPVLAAGGISDGRGVAAALALGADGAVMGTRFLVAEEAGIAEGWKRELVKTYDGGVTTKRSTLCDRLKENHDWPKMYDGRAIKNKGHEDEDAGVPEDENVRLYKKELQQGDGAWGPHGRMVTYSGTGVGLLHSIEPVQRIMGRTIQESRDILKGSHHNMRAHL